MYKFVKCLNKPKHKLLQDTYCLATGTEMEVIIAVRALPSAAPVAKNGKMYPPQYPAATVNEMATNLPTATAT